MKEAQENPGIPPAPASGPEDALLAALVGEDIDRILVEQEAAIVGDEPGIDEQIQPEILAAASPSKTEADEIGQGPLADEQELDAILAAQQAEPAPMAGRDSGDRTRASRRVAVEPAFREADSPKAEAVAEASPPPADDLDDALVMSIADLDEMLSVQDVAAPVELPPVHAAVAGPIEGESVLREVEAVPQAAARPVVPELPPEELPAEEQSPSDPSAEAAATPSQQSPALPPALRGVCAAIEILDRPFAALPPRVKGVLGYAAAALFFGALLLLAATFQR